MQRGLDADKRPCPCYVLHDIFQFAPLEMYPVKLKPISGFFYWRRASPVLRHFLQGEIAA